MGLAIDLEITSFNYELGIVIQKRKQLSKKKKKKINTSEKGKSEQAYAYQGEGERYRFMCEHNNIIILEYDHICQYLSMEENTSYCQQ